MSTHSLRAMPIYPTVHITPRTGTLKLVLSTHLFKLPAAKIWSTLLILMALNNHSFTVPTTKTLKAFLSHGYHLSYAP